MARTAAARDGHDLATALFRSTFWKGSVKPNGTQARKEIQEEACARCFLEWYNQRRATQYSLERAEEAFPELAGGTRWEFVARQTETDINWIALEVKRLDIPGALRQFMDWDKFFRRVTWDLTGRLAGSFLGIGAPVLKLTQKQQLRLRRAVMQLMLDVAPGIKVNENLDLGPMILNQFPNWPIIPISHHLEMQPQPHVVKNAHELWLRRTSDSGCSLELAMASPHMFDVGRTPEQDVRPLLDQRRANEQLGVARKKGAKETILLLDCHHVWRPNVIRQALAVTDSRLLSNMSSVYLVSVSMQRMACLWERPMPVQ